VDEEQEPNAPARWRRTNPKRNVRWVPDKWGKEDEMSMIFYVIND